MAKKYIVPQGTECIAYRRGYDALGRETIEKKVHCVRQDNEFNDVVLTPHRYIKESHKYPGNAYSVQLALQGYMIFSGKAENDNYMFFLAVPQEHVKIVNK